MHNASVIIGPPGTGKTTTLLNLIDSYLLKKTDPRKIGFVSFTKKSVNEAKSRAAVRFNKDEKFFFYFRTIHSLAFAQLSMTRNSVMEKKHYQEIGKLLGLYIKGKQANDCSVEELEKGDQLVFIESLSRMCCEELRYTYDNSEYLDFSFQELDRYQKTLVRYKEVNLLYDFTDMLVNFHNNGYKPSLDVLFVDEAQDLCPIQWRIVEQLAESSQKTYIAGDDDQAIFRWSGADVEYFIGLSKNHETMVLDQSYRLPIAVHKLSAEMIQQVNNRTEKKYSATPLEGKVEYINSVDDVDMSQGEWLILVRNTHMIDKVIEILRHFGYAYESQWKSSRKIDSLQSALVWEKLRSGKEVTVSEVRDMVCFMSNRQFTPNPLKNYKSNQTFTMSTLQPLMNFKNKAESWMVVLDKMSAEDRDYFISARKNGESFVKEARIRVSTIHGAKGGECENVVILTDMSKKTYTAMQNNYEDEVRVFYVGITRSKRNLYVVQPNTNSFFNI